MLAPWLALGYPALAHAGVWFHSLYLQWIALVWLLLTMLFGPLMRHRLWAWSVFVLGSTGLYFLTLHGDGMYALYLPPIAIPTLILWLFARSLRANTVPLVSTIAETMRGEQLPEALRLYTRRVTQMWCVVAAALLASAIGTALWASPEIWSLVTNVIHYLILGAVFVIEFGYRKIRYGHLEPWGLRQYLKRLARVRIRI